MSPAASTTGEALADFRNTLSACLRPQARHGALQWKRNCASETFTRSGLDGVDGREVATVSKAAVSSRVSFSLGRDSPRSDFISGMSPPFDLTERLLREPKTQSPQSLTLPGRRPGSRNPVGRSSWELPVFVTPGSSYPVVAPPGNSRSPAILGRRPCLKTPVSRPPLSI